MLTPIGRLGVNQAGNMVSTSSVAYLLVTHGSRDPRPDQAAQTLATTLATRLQIAAPDSTRPSSPAPTAVLSPPGLVGTATLELAEQPLHAQITAFARTAIARNLTQLYILPLFLSAGVHVMEDIPAEIALAQAQIGAAIALVHLPYLGASPLLPDLLAAQQADYTVEAWVVLAHGSRRSGGNQPVESLAAQVGGQTAYWAVEPHLEPCLRTLLEQGCRRIGIVPYLLFPGGITDAIAAQLAALQAAYPDSSWQILPPVGLWPGIDQAIVAMTPA